ncbi:Copper transport protein CTR2 [Vanrija pseudolonga]|uniref:Copper transport protein n=1 Tax=Vanrija pseudolonga TaxID=143232 RepID=A0AAF0Y5B5_9TREE|nr:Copper transport protein CTR2 [Vanrija pseudolonga]
MDHGGHGGHGGGSGGGATAPKCSMNMLWNHQVADTCVVFRSWHVAGWTGMVVSCLAIIAISVGYAALLAHTRAYERRVAAALAAQANAGTPTSSYSAVDTAPRGEQVFKLPKHARVRRAALYAASVAIAYWLMLVAMTYNTYLFSAIVVGAGIGHYIYEDEIDLGSLLGAGKGLACH